MKNEAKKLIKKSVKIIKDLQLKNGGFLATPKKGAYPYVYPRDGVVMSKSLNRVGAYKNSERFYYFIKKFSKIDKYKEVFHRYNSNGWPCVSRKNQNDNEGLVLHGIYDTYLHGKNEEFLEDMWPLIKQIVGLIKSYSHTGLVKTERSIHEFYRLEHGYDIWVNCACLRGLKDASKIAEVLGYEKERKSWMERAEKLKKNIEKGFYDRKLGVYLKNLRLKGVPDISQIAPFYFEIIASKEKLRKTLEYLEKYLWYEKIGGFRRFRKFEIVEDWHWYTGGSGSWVAFTGFMSRFYQKIGDKEMQEKCISWVEKVGGRTNGLLPEHVSTREEYEKWKDHEIEFNRRLIDGIKKSEELSKKFKKIKEEGLIYWAVPLGWSHAEYILAKKDGKK